MSDRTPTARPTATATVFEPVYIEAAGNVPKLIAEYIGRVSSKDAAVSIAKMTSPSGWIEPPQTPEFDEFAVVLRGEIHVSMHGKTQIVCAAAVTPRADAPR